MQYLNAPIPLYYTYTDYFCNFCNNNCNHNRNLLPFNSAMQSHNTKFMDRILSGVCNKYISSSPFGHLDRSFVICWLERTAVLIYLVFIIIDGQDCNK